MVTLSLLSVMPLPRLDALKDLRTGVEMFLFSAIHTFISPPQIESLAEKYHTSMQLYPAYLCTDNRLLDTACRLVSKLADTDIIGKSNFIGEHFVFSFLLFLQVPKMLLYGVSLV